MNSFATEVHLSHFSHCQSFPLAGQVMWPELKELYTPSLNRVLSSAPWKLSFKPKKKKKKARALKSQTSLHRHTQDSL